MDNLTPESLYLTLLKSSCALKVRCNLLSCVLGMDRLTSLECVYCIHSSDLSICANISVDYTGWSYASHYCPQACN